eukprot:157393-Rhodomonas_salina.1
MNMGENVKVEAEDGQQEQQIGAEEKYDIVSDLDTSGDIQEVVLDKNGRIPGGILPSSPCHVDMNYAFRSIPSFLDTSNPGFEKLVQDGKSAFGARSQNSEQYSSGDTYWVSAAAEPRCSLEREQTEPAPSEHQKLAKAVFDFHTQGLQPGQDYAAEKSGANWWTLVLNPEDDVGLHWDRKCRDLCCSFSHDLFFLVQCHWPRRASQRCVHAFLFA